MPKRFIGPISIMEIDGIIDTTHRVIRVMAKKTGKPVCLPRNLIDFLPGRVLMPTWLHNKIYRKNVEGRKTHKQ